MYVSAVHAILFGHTQQCIKMVLVGVHAAIGEQAADVQPASTATRVFNRVQQDWAGKEIACLDHEIDLGDIHVHNAPGADVQVTDLTVAHLAVRQPNRAAARMDQRIGIFRQQAVIIRLPRQ